MSNLHAVVMAGGSGVRFWPASRKKRPKQFLPLAHGVSLLQATLQRLSGLCPTERTWIVTNQAQARLIARLLPEFPARQILIEPEARDTAPCVALATAAIAAIDPNATMVLLPADHLIEPKSAFEDMLRRGAALAADGESLVTFGVVPTRPAA
jgi:mannose-1-phosphate guanylyltransferase